jgi:hypothetical protein
MKKCSSQKHSPTASIEPTHRISRRQRFVRILCQIRGASVEVLGVGHVRDMRSPNLGVDIRDFLNRASLARAAVTRGDYAAIRALSQVLDVFILAIDDERLVDRGDLVSVWRNVHDDRAQASL